MDARHALVRRPSPRLADGLVTHIARSDDVDADLALAQWLAYLAAFHDAGWETHEVAPADDCPDSVFVEDTMVVYGDLAVISRPGADERRPDALDVSRAARRRVELGAAVDRRAADRGGPGVPAAAVTPSGIPPLSARKWLLSFACGLRGGRRCSARCRTRNKEVIPCLVRVVCPARHGQAIAASAASRSRSTS